MTDKMPDEIYVQWGTLEKDVGIFSTRFSGDVYHSDPKYKALQERCERLEGVIKELIDYYVPTLKFSMERARDGAKNPKFSGITQVSQGAANAYEICIGCIEEALQPLNPTNNKRGE